MSDNEHGKTGLVMEGGGLRGIFTAGVIDVFLENNIEFKVDLGAANVNSDKKWLEFIINQIIKFVLYNYYNINTFLLCQTIPVSTAAP